MGCGRIATAHSADDNLETLLLHLVRGAGLHGLAGIPPRRGVVVRPLLTTSRAEIVAYLEANGVAHVEDSSNTDEGYARNRIRRQVVPVPVSYTHLDVYKRQERDRYLFVFEERFLAQFQEGKFSILETCLLYTSARLVWGSFLLGHHDTSFLGISERLIETLHQF